MTGCVEAEAGLWAIAGQFEQFLVDNPGLDIWQRAVKLMAMTLRNLCLTQSPDRCIYRVLTRGLIDRKQGSDPAAAKSPQFL